MMIQVRRNVFETNSSSTHSVTIFPGNKHIPDLEYLNIKTGEYGWEIEAYTSIDDKLSYALTFALQYTDDPSNFEMINDLLMEKMPNCEITYEGMHYEKLLDLDWDHLDLGYIDHQSVDEASVIFLSKSNLENFIFGQSSYFKTDNDNY